MWSLRKKSIADKNVFYGEEDFFPVFCCGDYNIVFGFGIVAPFFVYKNGFISLADDVSVLIDEPISVGHRISVFVIGLSMTVYSVATAKCDSEITAVIINAEIDVVEAIGKDFLFGSLYFGYPKT